MLESWQSSTPRDRAAVCQHQRIMTYDDAFPPCAAFSFDLLCCSLLTLHNHFRYQISTSHQVHFDFDTNGQATSSSSGHNDLSAGRRRRHGAGGGRGQPGVEQEDCREYNRHLVRVDSFVYICLPQLFEPLFVVVKWKLYRVMCRFGAKFLVDEQIPGLLGVDLVRHSC